MKNRSKTSKQDTTHKKSTQGNLRNKNLSIQLMSPKRNSKQGSKHSSRPVYSPTNLKRLSKKEHIQEFEDIINSLDVSVFNKRLLLARYITQLEYFHDWMRVANFRYNICRVIIGIGSMTLPTIQSIQSSTNVEGYDTHIFWASIFISIAVMISNSFIGLFSLDQKYHKYKTTFEKLSSAGWIFFELSGKYENQHYNHEEGLVSFFNEIENIKKMFYSEEDKKNTHAKEAEREDSFEIIDSHDDLHVGEHILDAQSKTDQDKAVSSMTSL